MKLTALTKLPTLFLAGATVAACFGVLSMVEVLVEAAPAAASIWVSEADFGNPRLSVSPRLPF